MGGERRVMGGGRMRGEERETRMRIEGGRKGVGGKRERYRGREGGGWEKNGWEDENVRREERSRRMRGG